MFQKFLELRFVSLAQTGLNTLPEQVTCGISKDGRYKNYFMTVKTVNSFCTAPFVLSQRLLLLSFSFGYVPPLPKLLLTFWGSIPANHVWSCNCCTHGRISVTISHGCPGELQLTPSRGQDRLPGWMARGQLHKAAQRLILYVLSQHFISYLQKKKLVF